MRSKVRPISCGGAARREIEALANSAGSDFLAALLTALDRWLDVPQAAAYLSIQRLGSMTTTTVCSAGAKS
jgi:hypothetical protein